MLIINHFRNYGVEDEFDGTLEPDHHSQTTPRSARGTSNAAPTMKNIVLRRAIVGSQNSLSAAKC
jgi:hypothetical protein